MIWAVSNGTPKYQHNFSSARLRLSTLCPSALSPDNSTFQMRTCCCSGCKHVYGACPNRGVCNQPKISSPITAVTAARSLEALAQGSCEPGLQTMQLHPAGASTNADGLPACLPVQAVSGAWSMAWQRVKGDCAVKAWPLPLMGQPARLGVRAVRGPRGLVPL